MSEDFTFWKMAYDIEAVDKNFLRQAVITDKNKNGEITKEEFKRICGEEFKETISLF